MSPKPAERSSRLALIGELCSSVDLAQRLSVVPPSAKVRGLFFAQIDRRVVAEGHGDRYHDLFPKRPAPVLWAPATDFLVQLVVGGALIAGVDNAAEGMFEIGRGNAVNFGDSLLGKMLLRFLARDPKQLLRQGLAARRQSYNVGHWELAFPGEREAVVTMFEEYLYMDSYLVGAAQGTFESIGIPVKVEVILRDSFNGQHILRW
jgi:uncharacterized protein (TIGR02265 family)